MSFELFLGRSGVLSDLIQINTLQSVGVRGIDLLQVELERGSVAAQGLLEFFTLTEAWLGSKLRFRLRGSLGRFEILTLSWNKERRPVCHLKRLCFFVEAPVKKRLSGTFDLEFSCGLDGALVLLIWDAQCLASSGIPSRLEGPPAHNWSLLGRNKFWRYKLVWESGRSLTLNFFLCRRQNRR